MGAIVTGVCRAALWYGEAGRLIGTRLGGLGTYHGAMRALHPLLFVAPLLFPLPALAAQIPQEQVELQRRHHQQVTFERHVGLQKRWRTAGPDERAGALRLFDQLRGRGVPAIFAPRVNLVTEAWHVLGGLKLADEKTRSERRLADSLDLRLVPGVFGEMDIPASEAVRKLGQPLTVMVTWLKPVPVPEGFELALYWISPQGEETLARAEPFVEADFIEGFPMYIRAPRSQIGTWYLLPEIRTSRGAGRGFPVPVECVPDLSSIADPLVREGGGPNPVAYRRPRRRRPSTSTGPFLPALRDS